MVLILHNKRYASYLTTFSSIIFQTQVRLILNSAILIHLLRLGGIKHQIWIQSSILLELSQLVSGWGILVHV